MSTLEDRLLNPHTAALEPAAAPATTPRDAEAAPRTQVERACQALRADIISGQLPPGARLRVEHLKDRYGVGAGTLREALTLLMADALVTAEGQRGFRVAAASLADLADLTDMRVRLETEALRQSIRRGDAQWRAELHAAYAALAEAEAEPATHPAYDPRWEALNRRFHQALIAAHGSPWTDHFLAILYRHSARYRHVARRLVALPQTGHDVRAEHAAIFQAAIQGREARAALALEAHVRTTLDVLSQGPNGLW